MLHIRVWFFVLGSAHKPFVALEGEAQSLTNCLKRWHNTVESLTKLNRGATVVNVDIGFWEELRISVTKSLHLKFWCIQSIMLYQWRTLWRSFDSRYLEVHDDLSLVHIFCVDLDPVDPQGLHRNTKKHYSCCATPVHQHNTDTSAPPQTPTRLPQGWPLSWPHMETIYETSVYVSDVHVYVRVLTSCPDSTCCQ